MPTVIREQMIDDAFYTKTEAYALFRDIFVGVVETFPFLPDAPWIECYGQVLNVVDYPVLGAKLGSTYGGDGVTTFGLPDYRGRVTAGLDNMGGVSANRLTDPLSGVDGDALGETGGTEAVTLTIGQLPSHTHGPGTLGTDTEPAHQHAVPGKSGTGSEAFFPKQANGASVDADVDTDPAGAHAHAVTTGVTGSAGSNQPHNNVQPTIIQYRCILSA